MMKDRYLLWLFTLALLCIGITFVYSASGIFAEKQFNNSLFFLKRELIFAGLGLVVMTAAYYLDMNVLCRCAPWIFLLGIGAVLLTYSPLGVKVGGAQRWIRLSIFNFQPSELLKYAVIIFLAAYYHEENDKVKTMGRGFILPLFMTGIAVLPILGQPDFGTAVMTGFTCMLLLFVAGVRFRYLLALALGCVPFLVYFIISAPYRLKRVLSFLDPWQDPQGAGFQIVQSFLAIGRGQLTGVGLGQSTQKLFYLPEAHTDFIFAILAEEMGFVGGTLIVLLFVGLTGTGFWIAMRARNVFEHLLALGCISLLTLQALFNIAVVTGMVPTKGIPLPFISFGGSNLLMNLFAVGLLAGISRHRELEQIQDKKRQERTKVPWFKAPVRRGRERHAA